MTVTSPLRIATRGSQLALWQADFIISLLSDRGLDAEKLVLTTTGDRVQDRFLHEIGGKGLFTKELEQALLDDTADLAVHSLKDMPARLQADFTLAAILPRHSPRDLFILSPALARRVELNANMLLPADLQAMGPIVVATGSLRRTALLKRHAPNFQCVGVRGNVDTRLRKLASGEWDALILAEASLTRLGIKDVVARPLAPDWFIPCAAQGALAIEMRRNHPDEAAIHQLGHLETQKLVTIERELLARLGGDCTMPFGCLATVSAAHLNARAIILGRDGRAATAEINRVWDTDLDVQAVVTDLYGTLVEAGALPILAALGLSGAAK